MPLGRVLALTLLNRFSRSYLPQKNPNSPPGTGYDRKNPAFTSGGNRTGSFFAYYPLKRKCLVNFLQYRI